MGLQNTFVLDVDLKEINYDYERRVTANDNTTFVVNITDEGVPVDLSNVATFALANTRLDQTTIVTPGTKTGSNQVSFELGQNETKVHGRVTAVVQLYDTDGRISTLAFNYSVVKDPTGDTYVPANAEKTLIQVVLGDGPLVIQQAKDAVQYAYRETDSAVVYAKTKGDEAVAYSKSNTDTAVANANTQAAYAKQVADENKTVWLNPVVNFAAIATTYPNPVFGSQVITIDDQKQYRYTTSWNWMGVYSTNGLTDLQAKVNDTNRQSQNLSHGVQVINAPTNSPVDLEVTGRTLTSLGMTPLENGKTYVLADKKTKIRTEGREGAQTSGVAKFTKSASLVTKADFVGKVENDLTINPHKAVRSTTNDPVSSLTPPSVGMQEYTTGQYSLLLTVGGAPAISTTNVSTAVAQHRFSFNIIEQIERKMGRIPADTTAGKVAWVKENVAKLTCNWHGFGSGPGGNKANITMWRSDQNAWNDYVANHSNGTVSKISYSIPSGVSLYIDQSGFIHFLAYAEPSDGTTPSIISTDYVELEIELKYYAVLEPRPTLTRTATFAGKVIGSTVENGNVMKVVGGSSLFIPSSASWTEPSQANVDKTTTLNGISYYTVTNTSGSMVQVLYSFDLIAEVERYLGKIPKTTVADKVQWLKDNVTRLSADWHGFGSSAGGNRATFCMWSSASSSWIESLSGRYGFTTSGSVSKVTAYEDSLFSARITTDGFVHFLAYAQPGDGTTPSTINTDFISLDIQVKESGFKITPSLDTRPVITRVANFEGKVSGSVVENPHDVKTNAGLTNNGLLTPSATTGWNPTTAQATYDNIRTLGDSKLSSPFVLGAGHIAQSLFSFDLIAEVERNIGRIPKATVADKVQWLKSNVQNMYCEWFGLGSSVGGSKATLSVWSKSSSVWVLCGEHSANTPTKLAFSPDIVNTSVFNDDGIVHFLAHAPASDGNTPSTINTDYVELQIALKQGATLHDPVVPLYEVDATEYANILVTWDEATVLNRYPRVQGVQHLQNLAIIAEGENLLPPFSEWTLHANAKVVGPYELELNATGNTQLSHVEVSTLQNRQYTISLAPSVASILKVETFDIGNSRVQYLLDATYTGAYTFTTASTVVKTRVTLYNNSGAGTYKFTNPMLTLGNTAKPFVPRNPSYLFAPVKLGQIGDKKDSLVIQGGEKYVRKLVEKDVVLDGSLGWTISNVYTTHKRLMVGIPYMSLDTISAQTLKHDGIKIPSGDTNTNQSRDMAMTYNSSFYINISNVDSGMGSAYAPSNDEIKAYFNGWQAKTVDANGKPTAWRSLGDGTDAPTQTLAYVSVTKAPNFTPYKLSYVLATPQLINVNHLIEGDIAVSGPTQVEVTSGVVVREKAKPVLDNTAGTYVINGSSNTNSRLNHRSSRIVNVYKNGGKDTWTLVTRTALNDTFGRDWIFIPQPLFDPSATYEVTYLVLDRHLQTVNAQEVKASYAGSIKDSVDMAIVDLTDLKTQSSINTNLIYRLLVQAKANNWSV